MSAFVPAVARIKCSNPVWEPQVWEVHVNPVKNVLLKTNLHTVLFLSLTLQLPKPKERLCLFVICVIFSSPPSRIGHHPETIFHHCNALKETRRRTTRCMASLVILAVSFFTVEHFTRRSKILQLMLPQNSSWGSSVFFLYLFGPFKTRGPYMSSYV